jgi:hypothetical protein
MSEILTYHQFSTSSLLKFLTNIGKIIGSEIALMILPILCACPKEYSSREGGQHKTRRGDPGGVIQERDTAANRKNLKILNNYRLPFKMSLMRKESI